jgi:serine/threonine protein kinase
MPALSRDSFAGFPGLVMPTLSTEKFVEVVRRSGLVEEERLNAALEALSAENANGANATASNATETDETQRLVSHLIEAKLITSWQSDQLLKGKHKGFFLGKYKLLGHLGSGGMSSVYLAEHLLMQRRVAIKVLPQSRVDDTSYLARFRREAQAAAALDHKNIVRAYDIDNEGKHHYIVMEYVEGRDLQNVVKAEGPLDYNRAADYIRQAAEGLQHAHDANLIHRDIKPANLLVDHKGVVKVLDMGLARFTDETTTSLTIAHDENVLGTADYLAPEQAKNSHSVDYRADIYSLGCTLYYALTGHPPFRDGTLAERILKHQKESPPSILVDRPDAPKELLEVCSRMMAKQPSARFQTAGEIATTLAAWLTSRGQRVESTTGSVMGSKPGAPTPPRRGSSGAPPVPPPRRGATPNLNDTLTGQDRDTIKGNIPPVLKPASGSGVKPGGSGPKGASNTFNPDILSGESGAFPVVNSTGSGSVKNSGSSKKLTLPTAKPLGSNSNLGNMPPVSTSGAFPTISGKVSLNTAAKVHKVKRPPPPWIWYAVGGGVLLVVLMIILVIIKFKG